MSGSTRLPAEVHDLSLIVVTVGGTPASPARSSPRCCSASATSPADYAPQFGSFIIYIIMIVVLIWRPQGLFSRAVAK
jgi:branched-chain amino acid transport system permease protein